VNFCEPFDSLGGRIAVTAGEVPSHILDHLPPAMSELERFGRLAQIRS